MGPVGGPLKSPGGEFELPWGGIRIPSQGSSNSPQGDLFLFHLSRETEYFSRGEPATPSTEEQCWRPLGRGQAEPRPWSRQSCVQVEPVHSQVSVWEKFKYESPTNFGWKWTQHIRLGKAGSHKLTKVLAIETENQKLVLYR